jgi:hypothetical protein
MRDVDQPDKIDVAWGSGAAAPYIRPVPIPPQPQAGGTAGFASWTTGFPPLNFMPVAGGGVPPFGADANGALNQISSGLQWLNAIGVNFWDGTLSAYIGGYPSGAVVQSPVTFGLFYQSTVNNNVTNPDQGGVGWTAFSIYGRIRLSNNLNLYVAPPPTGSDANPGTITAPFATMQRAVNVLYALYDLNGFTVTVNVAAGTYSAGASMTGFLLGQGGAPLAFSATGAVSIDATGFGFEASSGAILEIASNNFTLNVVANHEGIGAGVSAQLGGEVFLTGQVNFSYCASAHLEALTGGQVYNFSGAETISGPSPSHYLSEDSGLILADGVEWVLVNTPFWDVGFANVQNNGVLVAIGGGQTGAAVGPRFSILSGGQIVTAGAGVNYFPGSAAGTGNTYPAGGGYA